MHDVLVNDLVKLEVKLTDQLHMTIAVYWGVKQQTRPKSKLIVRPTFTLITFTALQFFIYLLLS